LPVPKEVDSGGIVENDALEDLVKPKPSQVADIEKPAPKKLRQPVKITIPALPVCECSNFTFNLWHNTKDIFYF
jgi:hypothetical protein